MMTWHRRCGVRQRRQRSEPLSWSATILHNSARAGCPPEGLLIAPHPTRRFRRVPVRARVPLTVGAAVTTLLITSILLQPPLAAPTDSATAGVKVSGNAFVLDGHPFIPRGFNLIAALYSRWCRTPATWAAANNFGVAELNTAKAKWHANTLRFQVSQPVLAGPNGAAYAEKVQTDVSVALNEGFVVDISMQDQRLACGPSEPLPSQSTEAAWATLITKTALATDPYVMFELFNEPQNSPTRAPTTNPRRQTWVDWLNGEREIEPAPSQSWSSYTPIGFQALVDYMRDALKVGNVLQENHQELTHLTPPRRTSNFFSHRDYHASAARMHAAGGRWQLSASGLPHPFACHA